MKKLRWGIIATGFIAGRFATGLRTSNTGKLVAVSSRTLSGAENFAKEHGCPKAYGSYSALLNDDDVDAVYIATPHPFHMQVAVAAAESGKHILCEKPIGMNIQEMETIMAAAKVARVTLMEAYMYRCHPQSTRVVELIKSGEIGDVKLVQATFGYHAPFDPEGRLFAKKLGGGGILDVGGYPASFACMVADAVSGKNNTAVELKGCVGTIDPRCKTDTLAIANLEFENGIAAQISCSTLLSQVNTARIHGTKGWIEVPYPWVVNPDGGEWTLSLVREDQEQAEHISGYEARGLYGIEADCFHQLVLGKTPEAPCMSPSDTLRVNTILENWLKGIS
ncbi:Gfo/Idh/MocA family protein [Pelagicoccus albus]|uniref:Gfo/Idh/MocA family oxidoreductase n=1 Tax=Pelagicoccus albus TaxID=415222 RepID=A0A7X1E7W1_9BACT|nr:Gfo/Idh/MocA family oxidoreductase [Pelagicoccus albus]MBC2605553.1 Gfo/Idh/MocA family oxidoreductase [Pelagicoccus albus]